MRETVIVLILWLVMTGAFGWLARRSLRTGVAPFQLNRFFGRPLITRTNSPFGFWYLTVPTIFGTIVGVLGSIGLVALIFAQLGAFGPLAY